MFNRAKKNTTKIVFADDEQDDHPSQAPQTASQASTPKSKPLKRCDLDLDDEEPEYQPIKKIKLVPNIPPAVKVIEQPRYENTNDYSSSYLSELVKMNEKAKFEALSNDQYVVDGDEQMEEEEIYNGASEVVEISSDSDEDQRMTHRIIQEKQAIRQSQDFISFSEQKQPQKISKMPRMSYSDDYESYPSEDDEVQRLDDRIIRDNSARRAHIRNHTVYQEQNFKQEIFNSKSQRVSGEAKLIQKIESISWDSIIKDADNALQTDKFEMERVQADLQNLKDAYDSSLKFASEDQLDVLKQEFEVFQEKQEFLFNYQDMIKEKVKQLFAVFDELYDLIGDHKDHQMSIFNKYHGYIDKSLIEGYVKKLEDVFEDVDEDFYDISLIQEHALGYLQSTHVAEESIIRYVSEIIYPLLKYNILRNYFRNYLDCLPFDYFDGLKFNESILANTLYMFSKSSLQWLIQLDLLVGPTTNSLFSQIISKTYQFYKQRGNIGMAQQSLIVIKQNLEILLDVAKVKTGHYQEEKIENIKLLQGILPQKNIDECLQD